MAALLFRGGNRRGRLSAERRSRMQVLVTPEAGRCAACRATQTWAAHYGLAGTNGSAINGLAGNRR